MAARGVYERPYQRIADDLRALIKAGRWQPGDRLPSQLELQRHYVAKGWKCQARGTVGRALALLFEQGYVHTIKGSGTIVADPSHWSPVP